MICGRRNEGGIASLYPTPDSWREDDTCSFCGSLNPDRFMARCEAGDVELGPTDKNYKVYVTNSGGEDFAQTYRDCPAYPAPRCAGPTECTHWITRKTDSTKFYFQHLSAEQRERFIALANARTLKIGVPGHFYVTPFFCRRLAGPEVAP